jgi:hypothetical protein
MIKGNKLKNLCVQFVIPQCLQGQYLNTLNPAKILAEQDPSLTVATY